ncbi:TetR/AcrR family transcriptional regulator [Vibrio panuliri]|uniref:TetR family transcriptional regulator n=1 Tax=Vibrio panuliri TaxID=1381081 RepID=A0A1Q9HN82_9VIBR|nr:TetR/AcrR family transcriptional regulator [Vibrio panuliri]KAB1457793.1 TetR/AcrR family transcriptional regulator [Vibrio panuliri]OLQ92276.1 TetR family transcriptional regulator [Vibrio panuliri]OLQ95294.1 TetR family transcriptional regulator [Vibrio panuliri]
MVKISDIKQKDIINSAIQVFAQKGFEQASMEGISKQAGVSKRTLYKYYPNKEALFEVIVDNLMCRFDDQPTAQFELLRSTEQQLIELTLKQLCYINSEDYQIAARMVIAECIRCPNASRMLISKFGAIEDSYGLHEWVRQGIAANRLLVPNVSLAVEQYIGSIKAVVFWPHLLAHKSPPSCDEVKIAVESAVKGFVATYEVSN